MVSQAHPTVPTNSEANLWTLQMPKSDQPRNANSLMSVGHGTSRFDKDFIESEWRSKNDDYYHRISKEKGRGEFAQGLAITDEISPDLFLSISDLQFNSTSVLEVELNACLMLGILLHGGMHMRIEGRDFRTRAVSQSVALIDRPTKAQNVLVSGIPMRFVGVMANQAWLERNDFGRFFEADEMPGFDLLPNARIAQFSVPPALKEAAVRLMDVGSIDSPFERLRREALAVEFFAEAISNSRLEDSLVPMRKLSSRQMRKMKDLRAELDGASHEASTSLEQLATDFGMSVSSLNRHFKDAFGTTVIAYLSENRMTAAKRALETKSVSVAEAAYIGGYSTPENFATAFRRRYGIAPRDVARRGRLRSAKE